MANQVQVEIPEEAYLLAAELAHREGIPTAQALKELLEAGLDLIESSTDAEIRAIRRGQMSLVK